MPDGFHLTSPQLREADVLKQVRGFLEREGWIVRRMFPGRWVPYFEHARAMKTRQRAIPRTLHPDDDPDLLCVRPLCVLWVETKKPGAKPKKSQARRLALLRAQGYEVIWCDCFDVGGAEPFLQHYRNLGLAERGWVRKSCGR